MDDVELVQVKNFVAAEKQGEAREYNRSMGEQLNQNKLAKQSLSSKSVNQPKFYNEAKSIKSGSARQSRCPPLI